MHSSVISKAAFIMIALTVLVSCGQGGSNVKARHAGEAKSGTNATSAKSAPVKSAAKASTTHNDRVSSSSTTTTNTVVYNGITQFKAE